MEFWGSCLLHLRTEMAPVEKLLANHNGVANPKGTSTEIKNAFREFWESVELMRTLFGSSFSEYTSFTSSFTGALSLEEQLSFHHCREGLVWIGSDATLEVCATVDFSNKIYTRFSPQSFISSFLVSHLTGSSEDLIIAVTELCSFIIFLMIKPDLYSDKIIAYTGDNTNVVTWLGHRKARNSLDRFLLRILSRLEHKYRFQVHPLYISTSNNVYCDDLTRLSTEQSQSLAADFGWIYHCAQPLLQWFLKDNLPRLILLLPCDDPEQTRFLLQLVEKRTHRKIPKAILDTYTIFLFGRGFGNFERLASENDHIQFKLFHWPSEGDSHNPQPYGTNNLAIFSQPPSPSDWDYIAFSLSLIQPLIFVFDIHPKHIITNQQSKLLGLEEGTTWTWEINSSSLGSATSRIRSVIVWAHKTFDYIPTQVPILLEIISLPTVIKEFLQTCTQEQVVPGHTIIHEPNLADTDSPTLLGKIELDLPQPVVGMNILSKGEKGNIVNVLGQGSFEAIFGKDSRKYTITEGTYEPIKTTFQVYSSEGVAFPFGNCFKPAGHGHTLIWDLDLNVTRNLSTLECWLISGGGKLDFPFFN